MIKLLKVTVIIGLLIKVDGGEQGDWFCIDLSFRLAHITYRKKLTMKRRYLSVMCLLLLLQAVTACGFTGPLYYPEQDSPVNKGAAK